MAQRKIEIIKEEINSTSADILCSGATTSSSVTMMTITGAIMIMRAITRFIKEYF